MAATIIDELFGCPICNEIGIRCAAETTPEECFSSSLGCDTCAQYIRCEYCRGTGQAKEIDRKWLERKIESRKRSKAFWSEHGESLRERARIKSKIFHEKYERDIVWDAEIIAPKQLRGAWIEVTYSPVMGEGTTYNWSMPGNDDWTCDPKLIESYTRRLGDVFWVLGYINWSCPFIIKIDKKGYFHLLHCNVSKDDDDYEGKMVEINTILRDGKGTWKKRENNEEENNVTN